MHLLFVTQESGRIPSGVLTVLDQLCRCWPESDEITILTNPTYRASARLLKGAQRDNIRLRQIPPLLADDRLNHWLSSFPRLFRIPLRLLLLPVTALQTLVLLVWLTVWMKRNGIEGVLSHNGGWPGGVMNRWAVYAGFLAAVPERVFVIHNTPQVPGLLIRKWLFHFSGRLIGRLGTHVVSVSRACGKSLEENVGFGRPLEVIYNGILGDLPTAAELEEKNTSPWDKRHPTVAFVGELHPRKGVHVLLEALRHVESVCELVLIGNGAPAYSAELEAMAKRLNRPVHFLGFRDDVQELYRWIDVLVLPALNFESFGMVIIEAMRSGVPVICSDFGGMKEVVVDGETGLVVPAGDAPALAKAIDRLLGDEDLRGRMGESGRNRMEKRFSSSTMTENYVRLFHSR